MRWKTRRQVFRALLEGDRCIAPASAFDPVSGLIAQELGFEAASLAGSSASLTVLGAPDLVILTLTELAEQAHRINRAIDLPLMVDADHGYGNALSVMRTVEELEVAGVAGLTIEDTLLPPPYGQADQISFLPVEEAAAKMRAAVASRSDPDLAIIGRTSALSVIGLEATLTRIKAYTTAGVDALQILGIETEQQLEAITAVTSLPLIVGAMPTALEERELLARYGVRVLLQGHGPILAAIQAVHATMQALRDGTKPRLLSGLIKSDHLKRLSRADVFDEHAKAYLGTAITRRA